MLLIVLYRFYLAAKEMGQKSSLQNTREFKMFINLNLYFTVSRCPKVQNGNDFANLAKLIWNLILLVQGVHVTEVI